MSLTNFAEGKLLDHILRVTAYTQPAGLYVSLHTADPGETGVTTNEVPTAATAYARTAVTFGAAVIGATTDSKNTADITFPVATGSWGTISHIGIFDAVTGGNCLFKGALTTQKTIVAGDQFKIAANNLTIGLD